MNDLLENLQALKDAVPAAPGFAELVVRHVQSSPSPVRRRVAVFSLRKAAIGAVAASVLVAVPVALLVMSISVSPQQSFALALKQAEKCDAVRYRVTSEQRNPPAAASVTVDHRTLAGGGRTRSEVCNPSAAPFIAIHNAQSDPDLELFLYGHSRTAEYTLADADRESLADDSPVAELKKLAALGVKASRDQTYAGKPCIAYETTESVDGGRHSIRRVVLIEQATHLPARIETDEDMSNSGQGVYHSVMDDFDWLPSIGPATFSVQPPEGYKVRYDLLKPLSSALEIYATNFDGRLPDRIDSAALAALKERLRAARVRDTSIGLGPLYDADWGFAVPLFAIKHRLDYRYYGDHRRFDDHGPRHPSAAVQIAPDSDKYDVLMSDFSRARLSRSELPANHRF